jgi:hypothetical protein
LSRKRVENLVSLDGQFGRTAFAYLAAIGVAVTAAPLCQALDAREIVERATEALKADWAADPSYANVERDETEKGEKSTSKTFVVLMIDGSEYHFPLALDDQPLPPSRHKIELVKLKEEVQHRRSQSPEARQSRIEAWQKQRDENGELLLDFPGILDLTPLGEETKDGYPAYVFSAVPKPGVVPHTRSEKVLTGVQGKAWVDKKTLHPFRVECTVIKTVPVYGPIARVLPGTDIEIAMTPVTDSIWLIDRVSIRLNVAKLGIFKSSTNTVSTYTRYRPNSVVLSELLDEADRQ